MTRNRIDGAIGKLAVAFMRHEIAETAVAARLRLNRHRFGTDDVRELHCVSTMAWVAIAFLFESHRAQISTRIGP